MDSVPDNTEGFSTDIDGIHGTNAGEDVTPNASQEQSTQSTQECPRDSQAEGTPDTDIWGSLVPFRGNSYYTQRLDFKKGKNKYTLGRGGRGDVPVDFEFPNLKTMSKFLQYSPSYKPTSHPSHTLQRQCSLLHRVGRR